MDTVADRRKASERSERERASIECNIKLCMRVDCDPLLFYECFGQRNTDFAFPIACECVGDLMLASFSCKRYIIEKS